MTPIFTVPPPIIEAIAKGAREMKGIPNAVILSEGATVLQVDLWLDAGGTLTFLRGPDMDRT